MTKNEETSLSKKQQIGAFLIVMGSFGMVQIVLDLFYNQHSFARRVFEACDALQCSLTAETTAMITALFTHTLFLFYGLLIIGGIILAHYRTDSRSKSL